MEGTEKASSIIVDNTETDELVDKLLSTGSKMTVKIDKKERKCFWVKTGFETRPLIKAYAFKRIKDAAQAGILESSVVEKEITVNEDNVILNPPPSCDSDVVIENLGLNASDKKIGYSYFSDIGMIYFSEPPKKVIKVKYFFYDTKLYDEIYNNAVTASMIYESLREDGNHEKRVFKSPGEVGRLSIEEVSDILEQFTSEVKLDEEKIKKSQGLQVSEEKDVTQKDTK